MSPEVTLLVADAARELREEIVVDCPEVRLTCLATTRADAAFGRVDLDAYGHSAVRRLSLVV